MYETTHPIQRNVVPEQQSLRRSPNGKSAGFLWPTEPARTAGAGSAAITAQLPGGTGYAAAADVAQDLTINKANATITVVGFSGVYDGAAHGVVRQWWLSSKALACSGVLDRGSQAVRTIALGKPVSQRGEVIRPKVGCQAAFAQTLDQEIASELVPFPGSGRKFAGIDAEVSFI
jgi:hypothetical protein